MSIIINKPAQENLDQVLKNGSTATDPITLNLSSSGGITITTETGVTPFNPDVEANYFADSVNIVNHISQRQTTVNNNGLGIYTIDGNNPIQSTQYTISNIFYYQEDNFTGDFVEHFLQPSSNLDGGTYVLTLPNLTGRLAVMENVAAGLTIDTTSANQTLQVSQGNLTIPTVAIGVFFVNLDLFTFGDGLTVYIGKKTAGNLKFQATSGGTLHGNSTVSGQGLIIITRLGGDFYINQP